MSAEQVLYNRPLPGARLNMAHPLTRGLVGCWLLNETSGLRAMDLSPYGNHGLLKGFVEPPLRAFNGLIFDGVDDYVDIGNPEILDTTAITVEAWFNRLGAGSASNNSIVSNRMYLDDKGWDLATGAAATDTLLGGFRGGSATVSLSAGVDLVNGQWYQAVLVGGVGEQELFEDAIQRSSDTKATPFANNGFNVTIGNHTSLYYFNGQIALVRIWNRVLNDEDIKALHRSPYKPMGLPMFL